MRLALVTMLAIALLPRVAEAQGQEANYEAVILGDDVFVRSGPSRNHYPTGKLGPGDRVIVHRHEPGGWLMISPPAGSYDWILADNVQLTQPPRGNQPGVGTILANRVAVWIGSEIEDNSRESWHVMLSRGKRVSILGEKMFNDPEGTRKWYKIAPPAGDHRWILGQFVRRVGAEGENPDPFDNNPDNGNLSPPEREKERRRRRARQMLTEQRGGTGYDDRDPESGGLKERKMVRTETEPRSTADGGTLRTGPTQNELDDDRSRMARLDAQFRSILRSETSQWNFDRLEQDYKNLQNSAAHVAIQRQITLRLRKVAQYKQIKAEHDEFVRLTRESDEREAKILSLRSQPASAATQPASRFSGAGIVQRSIGAPRGAPVHALVAPDGRVLAYLQAAQGVNLDRFLGRSVGITGPRTHRPEWHTDHILVEELTPVRLKP